MMRWLLVVGLFAGCSFALTGPDPKASRSKAPSCDSSKGLVVADMIGATIAGVATLGVGASNSSEALVPALIGTLYVVSALRGNSVVGDCRRANEEFLARSGPHPTQPPAVAEDQADDDRPPPRVPQVKLEPRPVAAVAPAPVQAPAEPPAPGPVEVPPSIELWVQFWKEIR